MFPGGFVAIYIPESVQFHFRFFNHFEAMTKIARKIQGTLWCENDLIMALKGTERPL